MRILCAMVRWTILALALALGGPAVAAPEGRVQMVDADTLDVGGTRVRLFGIDAPERDQTCQRGGRDWACGRWATREAQGMFNGTRAVCRELDRDRYGRVVARCFVDGADMADRLVRAGLATAFLRYSRDYVDAEKAAASAGAGIFASDFTAPADHRAARAPRPVQSAPGDCRIKGNISRNGRIYHLPGQEHYDATRISRGKGERWFCTEAEARAAGWRRARR